VLDLLPHPHYTRSQKSRGAMDPNTKLLMDEMKKLGDRFSAVESRVDSLESSLGDRFNVVEASSSEFASWRPGVDAAVEDLKLQIGAINKQLDRVVLDRGSIL